jgi:hypothetical protein
MQRARWLTVLRLVALVATVLLLLALPSSGYRAPSQPGSQFPTTLTLEHIGWIVLALPLIAHGLAHLSGLIAPFTPRDLGFAERHWIFTHDVTLHSAIGRAFGGVWLMAAVALATAGVGLLLGQAWWPACAVAASVISLAAIVTWWKAVPKGAKAGAAFDLLVLLAALQPMQSLISGAAH